MKNLIILCVITVLSFTAISAQTFSSGYFIADNEHFTEANKSFLGDKVKTILSQSGLRVSEGFFPIVTILKYNHSETIPVQGIRTIYKTMGSVNLIVAYTINGALFSSIETSIEGTATNKEIAFNNAIKNVSFTQKQLKEIVDKIKANYTKCVEEYASDRLKTAKAFKAKGNYLEAVDAAGEVPNDSKLRKSADELIDDAEAKMDEKEKREYELSKMELENQDKASERASQEELARISKEERAELARIKKEERVEMTSLRTRLEVEEKYSDFFRTYFLK